jgi:hypothetical protein
MCVLIFKQILSEVFLFIRKIQPNINRKLRMSLCKVPVTCAKFQSNWNFLDRFSIGFLDDSKYLLVHFALDWNL